MKLSILVTLSALSLFATACRPPQAETSSGRGSSAEQVEEAPKKGKKPLTRRIE